VQRWTVFTSLLCLVFAANAVVVDWWPARVVLGWLAFDAGWLAFAYGVFGPRLLGKRPDGSMPLWSLALLAPYVVLNHLMLRVVRLSGRRAKFDEIAPRLFLGPLPYARDHAAMETADVRAVLDMTGEFARSPYRRDASQYLLMRLMDGTSPTPQEIETAVRWCRAQMESGGVLVHCAAGKGRSATIVAATLIDMGLATDADEAVALMQSRRPSAAPNSNQLAALRAWAAGRKR